MGSSDSARQDQGAFPDEDSTVSLSPKSNGVAELTGALGGDVAPEQPAIETEIWQGRTHWKHYAGRLLLWLGANVLVAFLVGWIASSFEGFTAGHAFWTIVGILLISGLLVVGRVLLPILSNRYRLTSERLFIEHGLLSRTIDQTELIRVDDVRIYKSFLDRIFGLGSVAVISSDATDRETLITGIREPETVAEAIRTRMRALRKKSLFIENL